jgi:hypothetical protein
MAFANDKGVREMTDVLGFGADDRPVCPRCKSGMRVSQRNPHHIHGDEYEHQTLTCGQCGHSETRSATGTAGRANRPGM